MSKNPADNLLVLCQLKLFVTFEMYNPLIVGTTPACLYRDERRDEA